MALFSKRKGYDYAEQACSVPDEAYPDLAGIGSYHFVEAVRQVVNAPQPLSGPPVLLFAENGTLANPEDLPNNVTVIYYEGQQPFTVSAGY